MLRFVFSFSVLSLLTVSTAHAQFVPWEVTSVSIHEVPSDPLSVPLAVSDCTDIFQPQGLPSIGWQDIIAIGQQVWSIVEAGKPVVNATAPVVSALPRGLTCWTDLDSWKVPQVKTYEVDYKNLFGMQVVTFRFRLQYTYGGGNNGVGAYLANVTVMPEELNVDWGYNFDASVEVQNPVNIGTATNPEAAMQIDLKWTVKTVLNESQNSFNFVVQGDGTVTTPN